MDSNVIKNVVSSAFRMHGLSLRSEAAKYLVAVLSPIGEDDREDCLEKIIEAVQKQHLSTSMVSKELCAAAVEECNSEKDEDSGKIFTVVDAFDVPRLTYVPERKKFIPESQLGKKCVALHADANTKADMFNERYKILHQRTSRHDLFTPPILGARIDEGSRKFQLKPLEFLLGSSSKLCDLIVLGMLVQLKEGKWSIEDPTGCVELDLSQANFHHGLFTENCFVLAEGWYEDDMFHVNAFGLPPPEPAKSTRAYFGNVNFFGGPSAASAKSSAKLLKLEEEASDAMIAILSDVWLDDNKVMEKLRVLFMGYAEYPPVCFILCGSYMSKPYGSETSKVLKESFRTLARILLEFPTLVEKSKFVFVPSCQDPGPGPILPRPALPKCIIEDFQRRIPTSIFASNPCRIQYCTQEILVFREDIVTKMCRNCVRFPKEGTVPNHFAKTILAQAHLCPLPLHVEPIYWAYDRALHLYPLPDLIICADRFDPFSVTHMDTNVVNPGSFSRSEYAFKVYVPSTRQVEDSKIGDD